jgi:hypothetical protein
MSSNLEKERQRLTELYASIPTEQLQQIASQSSDLTEIANTVLGAEIKRRGLTLSDFTISELASQHSGSVLANPTSVEKTSLSVDSHPSDNFSGSKLVVVRRFRGLFEAQMAKASLDGADIQCFLADDNMIRMDWFVSDAIGGVKLLVGEADVADALAVLDQPIPESFAVDGVGEYKQPRCPQCGSLDVNFGNQPLVYGSLFDGKPTFIPIQGWFCDKCSHTWEDPAEDVSAE